MMGVTEDIEGFQGLSHRGRLGKLCLFDDILAWTTGVFGKPLLKDCLALSSGGCALETHSVRLGWLKRPSRKAM
jgi:hypothetical protein